LQWNWNNSLYFIFERNEDHYAAEEYRIPFVRYDIINDQSVAVNEFRQGRLDVAAVSGEFYETYKNSPYLKLSPVTTFFRFAFSLDRPGDNNPIMQYVEFRQALYFAVDRETFVTDVRAPGFPTHGMLGPVYYSSEQNPFSYRSSTAGQGVLAF
jgi:oligopeptide transport system substrate-binding protein